MSAGWSRLLSVSAGMLVTLLTVGETMGQDITYREPYRPQFHFSPAQNWMNDPNGMVFFEGEYHLFYQHNPFGNQWGHMSWGHAVSSDLVHWKHLPVAIPEADDVMIFSGSAVVDWKNTSGFGVGDKPPLVVIYTGHHTNRKLQDQRIAYSTDRGRTWTKWSGNPVLDLRMADFRDPKVLWHERSKQWVMVVAIPLERKVGFYGSPDLKQWRPLSEFGPAGSIEQIWECPDLFPLPVEGDPGTRKWVLVVNVGGGAPAGGSGCQYFVGEFDGRRFVLDHATHPTADREIQVPRGTIFADFENGYGDWEKTGNAFGDAPADGALSGQMAVEGYLGDGLVNSFQQGDQGKGRLRSPEFTITDPFIHFLIGGGAHKAKTCINLLLEGEVVLSATGKESERLDWHTWEVKDYLGEKAVLEIVDEETAGWGHINVDHILFSPEALRRVEPSILWADHGSDFYAAVSWSDIPPEDGRRIWLGWMSNWQYAQDVPTTPWRSAMTIPRELSLQAVPGAGFRLAQAPVKELKSLRVKTEVFAGGTMVQANRWLATRSHRLLDLSLSTKTADPPFLLRVAGPGDERTDLRIEGSNLSLDRRSSGEVAFHEAFPGIHRAPLRPSQDGSVSIRLLVDTSSIEVFANGGETVITGLIFPADGARTQSLHAVGEQAPPEIRSMRLSELQSAW